MQYYRCKCGEATAWGSIPPPQCSFCPTCKSNLALSAGSHTDPKPHEFYPSRVETDEGEKSVTTCRLCMRTKKEIEKEDF